MTTGIAAFEVPPGEDEAFLAVWRQAGEAPAVLYRALRADVTFRFVAIGEVEGADRYEVVREGGQPDTEGGVVRIELVEGGDPGFPDEWERTRAALGGTRGYLGARLLAGTGPARFPFVEIARWSSPLMIARAGLALAPLPGAHAAMYLPVAG